MLLTCEVARDWVYAIAGATLLTDIRLQGRAPRERTRLKWSTGPQTIATTVAITATRTVPFVPRVGMFVGLIGVPLGLRVTVVGKSASGAVVNLGGNSQTQRVALLPDGSLGIYWVFEAGLPAIVAFVITLYNDVGGVVAIPAGAVLDLGLANVMPAVWIDHEAGGSDKPNDPSKADRLLGGGISRDEQQWWRTMSLTPVFGDTEDAYGAGIEGVINYAALQSRLARDPFVLVVEEFATPALIQATSLFGMVKPIPGFKRLQGGYYQFDPFEFEGVPN